MFVMTKALRCEYGCNVRMLPIWNAQEHCNASGGFAVMMLMFLACHDIDICRGKVGV